MSVLIKGMEMPTACSKCDCGNGDYGFCQITRDSWWHIDPSTERMDNCPIVPIPDHGDLIDRNDTTHEMWMKECYECNRVYDNNGCKGCAVTRMINVIACAETAPTVIPAERSEE